MTTAPSVKPFVLSPHEGRAIWHLGGLMNFKATGDTTGGRLWLAEAVAPHSIGVPMHTHADEDELWYVLEGEVTFFVGDQVVPATQGTVAFGPRDVPHSYRVDSPTARFLAVGVSAGFEHFFFESGEPAGMLTLPPDPVEPDPARLAELAGRFGCRLVGPPPGHDI